MEVAELKCRGRKTWRECVNDGMKLLGLQSKWTIFRDMGSGGTPYMGQTSNPGRNDHFKNK